VAQSHEVQVTPARTAFVSSFETRDAPRGEDRDDVTRQDVELAAPLTFRADESTQVDVARPRKTKTVRLRTDLATRLRHRILAVVECSGGLDEATVVAWSGSRHARSMPRAKSRFEPRSSRESDNRETHFVAQSHKG
jgi:hypothetical protein